MKNKNSDAQQKIIGIIGAANKPIEATGNQHSTINQHGQNIFVKNPNDIGRAIENGKFMGSAMEQGLLLRLAVAIDKDGNPSIIKAHDMDDETIGATLKVVSDQFQIFLSRKKAKQDAETE